MDALPWLLFAGGLAGGLVSGLAGFGVGLAALPLWLLAIEPRAAAPLVALCSVAAHLLTWPLIRHAVDWARLRPYLLGGVLGVPAGVVILSGVPATGIKLFLGVFLVIFCSAMLARRQIPRLRAQGAAADGAVGFGGGVLGGLAGLSGPLPTLWVSLHGWSRDRRRALFQLYNFAILGLALALMGARGLLDRAWLELAFAALPGTLAGAWLGRRLYARLGDDRFLRLVLALLALSGLAIAGNALLGG